MSWDVELSLRRSLLLAMEEGEPSDCLVHLLDLVIAQQVLRLSAWGKRRRVEAERNVNELSWAET